MRHIRGRRALCVLHDAMSSPGLVGSALRERGWRVDEMVVVPADRHASPNVDASFPDGGDYDLLVPMGAPWGAYEDERIGNWLDPELRWLADTVAAGGAVFGICFGAQALSRALGGTVAKSPRPELGWVDIDTVDRRTVPPGPWFQWHGDAFTLPPGAIELARNAAAIQAYRIGRSLGVQFHPEVTTGGIKRWVDNGGEAVVRAHGVDPAGLLVAADKLADDARHRADALVAGYLDRIFLR
jgi:GMP synthase-like glutamine amidotransferase